MRKKFSNNWRRERFLFLPRRLRKLRFIQLKNDIRRAAPILGGKFMTHDLVDGDNGWVDWIEAQLPSIANSGAVSVFEHWKLDFSYGYGVGLEAVMDVPKLSVDAINRFVDEFLLTENDYTSAKPITYRFEEIEHRGLPSNALVDPWDWPTESLHVPH